MKITSPTINKLPYLGNKDNLTKSSFLIPTLYGIRRVFGEALGLSEPIEFQFTDALKKTLEAHGKATYPRTFFKVLSLDKSRDRVSSLAMSQLGQHARGGDGGEAVKKAITFPVDLNLEFHYVHTDAMELLQMVELLALMTFSPIFSFKFNVDNAFEHTATVTFEDQIGMGEFTLEDGSDPGSSELVIPFSVRSYVGFVTDEPWVHVIDAKTPVVYDVDIVNPLTAG